MYAIYLHRRLVTGFYRSGVYVCVQCVSPNFTTVDCWNSLRHTTILDKVTFPLIDKVALIKKSPYSRCDKTLKHGENNSPLHINKIKVFRKTIIACWGFRPYHAQDWQRVSVCNQTRMVRWNILLGITHVYMLPISNIQQKQNATGRQTGRIVTSLWTFVLGARPPPQDLVPKQKLRRLGFRFILKGTYEIGVISSNMNWI